MKFKDLNQGGGGSGASSGTFLKMADGERLKAVFRGDPYDYRQHWVGGRSQLCAGSGCELCKNAKKKEEQSKFRFRINVLVQVDGVWVAKIFENGFGLYRDLEQLHSEYDLEKTVMWLQRSGTGTDTEYSVMPAKDNGGMKPEDMARLGGIPLNPLGPKEEKAAS